MQFKQVPKFDNFETVFCLNHLINSCCVSLVPSSTPRLIPMQIQIPAEMFVYTWWSRLYPAAEATQLGRLYNESLAARWERRPTHLSYFLTTTNSTVPSPPSSSVLSYHCKPFFHEKRVLPHWLYSSPPHLDFLYHCPLLPFLTWPVTNSLLVIEPPINHQEIYFPPFPRLSSYRIWRSWNQLFVWGWT